MTEAARRRAEACFALARSTTFEAERATAIERGTEIAKAAGLDLDLFDIPGRAKTPPPRSRFRSDLFERAHSPFFDGTATKADFDDVMSRFREEMRGWSTGTAEEAAREAQARFDALNAAMTAARKTRLVAELAARAVAWLWQQEPPVRVYQGPDAGDWQGPVNDASRRWIIPDENDLEYSDEGIVEVARRKGWNGPGATAGHFGGELAALEPAIAFLRAKGIEVEPAASPGYWRVGDQGVVPARRVILSARLRGFEL